MTSLVYKYVIYGIREKITSKVFSVLVPRLFRVCFKTTNRQPSGGIFQFHQWTIQARQSSWKLLHFFQGIQILCKLTTVAGGVFLPDTRSGLRLSLEQTLFARPSHKTPLCGALETGSRKCMSACRLSKCANPSVGSMISAKARRESSSYFLFLLTTLYDLLGLRKSFARALHFLKPTHNKYMYRGTSNIQSRHGARQAKYWQT